MFVTLLVKDFGLSGHAVAGVDIATECSIGSVIRFLPNENRTCVVRDLDGRGKDAAA